MALVLIVDDEIDIREALRGILETEGYTVVTARDGKEGLQSIRERMPDVVLLDLMMPVMSGGDLLEHLRKDGDTKKLPVVIMTAGTVPRALARHRAPVLTKPFDIDALLQVVDELLRKRVES